MGGRRRCRRRGRRQPPCRGRGAAQGEQRQRHPAEGSRRGCCNWKRIGGAAANRRKRKRSMMRWSAEGGAIAPATETATTRTLLCHTIPFFTLYSTLTNKEHKGVAGEEEHGGTKRLMWMMMD